MTSRRATSASRVFAAGCRRGGVLVTALLIATVLGIGLAGYLALTGTALKVSHRTFFVHDASNLAEAGLEDALYCFNQVEAGTPAATAWSGWTIVGSSARRTLPQFNRDQRAIGTVKVFVNDYNNAAADAYIISQATITPFDGSPRIVRVMRVGVKQSGMFVSGLAGINGISFKGHPYIDSFNSNPTNSPTGPWLTYTSALSRSNATVIVKSGSVDLGNGQIKGNLLLGAGVAPPPANQVTGTITTGFSGSFPPPVYPTAASVSRSYNLGSTIPAVLPAAAHLPAADGRYYYFTSGASIANTTITGGRNVVIVGTTTSLKSATIGAGGKLAVYIDGPVDAGSKNSLNNANWAGALQVFTTTTAKCSLSGNGELRGSFYMPNAALEASGGGSGSGMVGSFIVKSVAFNGNMAFHYDEALRYLNTTGGGSSFSVSSWGEIRGPGDIAAAQSATGGFLP